MSQMRKQKLQGIDNFTRFTGFTCRAGDTNPGLYLLGSGLWEQGSDFSTSSLTFVISVIAINCHPGGYEVASCGFDLHFPNG